MTDIVERLKGYRTVNRDYDGYEHHVICDEAAAEITRLRALVEEMGKALGPFAKVAETEDRTAEELEHQLATDSEYVSVYSHDVRMGHFRRARATLAKAKEQS
jgi:hypothetical protein